ncbi:phage integrase SAM-like domain-containing protein [Chryseosolibacter indicus]|uniref:Phage integrase SAM-like domain-containing protein n=1 Tax=Chryseosolibacter indicus TaxID=2782351 RepID=A0ABS5VX29_9BACT|nr:phage integrase SAM-like domain-containing protein [Chryseosolibacter indicus]MBT1705397.1 phage integrase SAM-like domain-containing protein [Chryseosolibacter indicus]
MQTGLHASAVVKPRPKFRDFFAELASEKIRFDNNAGNWASAFKHVLVFLGDDNPTIQEIDDIWLEEFRAYLLEVDKRSGKPRLQVRHSPTSTEFELR